MTVPANRKTASYMNAVEKSLSFGMMDLLAMALFC